MTVLDQLAASLAPLVARVRRDVTAIKREGAQAWTREPLNVTRLLEHVGGGASRGVSQIPAGDDRTQVAVLDFDSHGGEVGWPDMALKASEVASVLQLAEGCEPVLWRSSGGRGIHLYLLWDEPQDAYSVRSMLVDVLRACGLQSGTKGVVAGEVEVFPKQNSVPADGFGNQVILPLAGKSVPMSFDDLSCTWVAGDRLDAVNVDWLVSPPVPYRERPVRSTAAIGPIKGHEALRELLDAIPNTGGLELGYDEWFRVVAAIHHETGGGDEGLQLAHDFSARATGKYDAGFLDARVWPFIRSDGRDAVVGVGTLRRIAAGFGWHEPLDQDAFDDVSADDDRPASPSSVAPAGGVPDPLADAMASLSSVAAQAATLAASMGLATRATAHVQVPTPPAVKRRGIPEAHHLTTDQANANRLVNAFGRQVLVSAGRWHVWDGRRWLADEADVYRYGCQLSDLIRTEAQAIKARASVLPDAAAIAKAAQVAEALMKWAQKSEMKGTIEAAIGLARKMLTVEATELDRDPWSLNVSNGIVDLRTGELRPHNPDDLITKLVPVAYRPEATCEVWDRVLRQITRESAGNGAAHGAPIASYLQRWFGYCLTGMVTEQVFVVHWGGGSNGKSTVLGIMADTAGDYASAAPPGLMAASKGDRHPTEIAALLGRRQVTSHESGEGIVLREDFIKQATGDDVMTARFMREDFFSFSPTHKLQLLTNHKPAIKGQDMGIWRRVQLVPYLASFGTAEQVARGEMDALKDMGLVARLREELEGVLAWRVRGAVEWAAGGLAAPAAVLSASASYKAEQDRVGQFVAECCELDVTALEPLTDGMMGGLYPAYVGWCKDGGIMALSKARFADDLLRVVGVDRTVERQVPAENRKRRKLACVPGIRLLAD